MNVRGLLKKGEQYFVLDDPLSKWLEYVTLNIIPEPLILFIIIRNQDRWYVNSCIGVMRRIDYAEVIKESEEELMRLERREQHGAYCGITCGFCDC